MAEWNIKARATQCTMCAAPFVPGMKGHSLLDPSDEGYQRRDLCDACFKALPKDRAASSGAWVFTVPKATPQKLKKEPLQKETAEHLLRVLSERDDPADREAIYILAILLERSKQFVERKVTTSPEGHRIRLYEQRSTGDYFSIIDPQLAPEDLPAVQQRVLTLLEGPATPATDPQPPPRARVKRRKLHVPQHPRCGVLRKRTR